MNAETVRYEERGEVAHVTLLRDRIDMQLVRELTAVCNHLEDDSATKVVVFRGAGGVFCRGIDYADFKPDQPVDIHGFGKWEKMCVRIERLRKVTVSVLEGAVVGGGVQLALVTDARVMAPDATLQLDEVHHGFLPGMATYRLAKYVGLGHAKRLVMRCPVVTADEALRLGLVDRVTADVDAATDAVIAEFGPTHVVAVTLARRLLNESYEFSYEDAIGHFLAAQHRSISQTAFLETLRKKGGE
ncbi:MAG: enoyl-CoA hydratase/isomerase family protein [Alphaproteobacteria bacterium]|nr:enoyl-CoA hydratase/isomerase family protein [Alphaproteobacteria bacterium]